MDLPLRDQSNSVDAGILPSAKRRCIDTEPEKNDENHCDFFGDDSFMDISAGELAHLDALSAPKPVSFSLAEFHRCKVKKVLEGPPKQLQLLSCADKTKEVTCTVMHEWLDVEVKEDSIVSVRGVLVEGTWQIRGDNEHCMLITHADHLLSCTTLTSGLRCRRRAVFTEKFRGVGGGDEKGVMTLGSALHETTQTCLLKGLRGQSDVLLALSDVLSTKKMIHHLCSFGLKREDIEEMAVPYIKSISKFLENYLGPNNLLPKPSADTWDGTITKVIDIEDMIWAPQMGLKGKIDVTAMVKKKTHGYTRAMPLELKTGRSTDDVAHRAQVVMYSTMLAEVENNKIKNKNFIDVAKNTGVVVYLKENTLHESKSWPGETRDGLIMRNEIVNHVTLQPQVEEGEEGKKIISPSLPRVVFKPKDCGFCPYIEVCTGYLSKEEIPENFPEKMPHLALMKDPSYPQAHFDYFIHWANLLQLEQSPGNPLSRLWSSTPEQREGDGGACLSGLEIASVDKETECFAIELQRPGNSALDSVGLKNGDFVVLGNTVRYAVEFATVRSVSASTIILECEKDISHHFGRNGYHIDQYISNRGCGFTLASLAQILANNPAAHRLRQLAIDRKPPSFAANNKWEDAKKLMNKEFFDRLNNDQENAIKRVLESEDFTLIQGLPGTGKTATIVALTRVLVALGCSVLISSHTNSAVDNVLLRLLAHDIPLVRLGSKCTPQLAPHLESKFLEQSLDETYLLELYNSKQVFGVTCASAASHWLLRRRTFDYCIVDEATQVLQPATFAPLLSSKRFVLVGDPKQLQPVVTNFTASELGLKESLFERLMMTTDATATLGLQYRMNKCICHLANEITYKGALKCANPEVENATLKLTSSIPPAVDAKFPWLKRALSCDIDDSVLFLDIGRIHEDANEPEGTSKREMTIIKAIVFFLVQSGLSPLEIGVMSPFRNQVELLSSQLHPRVGTGVEISTIDQFQGKDKTVALLSCVKSFLLSADSPKQREGILNDLKRLTVAVTRARVKLLLVGDAESLMIYDPFRQLFGSLARNQRVFLNIAYSGK